ncbi:MAG: patatin-like phospholipase family protein [Betaproteobacteria bacterium]|nr:patatin-like phospholipase family protein [Betaproteobacteria bacterium]
MARAREKVGLILTGGGARAAYQIGVLKAVSEIVGAGRHNPFPIICGTSAGAINAAALSAYASHFSGAIGELEEIWRTFHVDRVYRSDAPAILRTGGRWLATLMQVYRRNPISLLDNSPLRRFLRERIDFGRIERNLHNGSLEALAVTASGYTSGHSVSFFQARSGVEPWERIQRVGVPTNITLDHLMASSALPFMFPAVRLQREFFGDGSMRQTAPISPALHLGADRIFVIGTGRQMSGATPYPVRSSIYPSLAQIAGHALNSIFLDTLAHDIDWLERINRIIGLLPPERRHTLPFRRIEVLVIAPSESIARIAATYVRELPRSIRFLLGALGGTRKAGSNLSSYLLFESGFCRALIELGHRDAMVRRGHIAEFFKAAL